MQKFNFRPPIFCEPVRETSSTSPCSKQQRRYEQFTQLVDLPLISNSVDFDKEYFERQSMEFYNTHK